MQNQLQSSEQELSG